MQDFSIRAERGDDAEEVAAIAAVVAAAFGRQLEADLVAAIRASEQYQPDASLVAVIGGGPDGDVVGHVMLSYVDLDDAGKRRSVLTLSPLAVAPAYQRQGLGSALVNAAVDVAERRGEALVLLEGSPTYYGRLGFEWSVPLGITIDLPSWAPPEAAQVRRLSTYDPAYRGKVVYPPAFTTVTSG